MTCSASLLPSSITSIIASFDCNVHVRRIENRNHPSTTSASHHFFSSKIPKYPLSLSHQKTLRAAQASATAASVATTHDCDVVIIGAGIIGLTIARQLLSDSDLSIAVVDRASPCSGATGAGQGYIWMVHKSPARATWDLSLRSRSLWEKFADEVRYHGLDPSQELGWKKTGSMLVGKSAKEADALRNKVKLLNAAGLNALFLDNHQLHLAEPDLEVLDDGGAAFLPDDCQLDAQSTVSYILKSNQKYSLKGRYKEFFHDPITGFARSESGEVAAVQTSKTRLNVKKAVIIATGCWSESLMKELFPEADGASNVPVRPRKGHLLVAENAFSLSLRHGLMEVGYVGHETARTENDTQMLSVSMTATVDAYGNLLLGSSRQFAGFSTDVEDSIVTQIWNRAKGFFPKLRNRDFSDGKVRVGLRPYMADGRPVIGRVPTSANAFIAAGHEGEGLCLALGTAELVADMVLGRPSHTDASPFAFRHL